MSTDRIRNELQRLIEAVVSGTIPDIRDAINSARTALSEPADGPATVAEGPSDEELRDLWSWAAGQDQGPWPTQYHCFARAVLARWGQPPADVEVAELIAQLRSRHYGPGALDRAADLLERQAAPVPPAEGEAAELVAWLHGQDGGLGRRAIYARIAELLERRAAPVPVPVAERLPGPEDCDESGMCWWLHAGEDGIGDWIQRKPYPGAIASGFFRMTHWLPAHALPLPAPQAGEVQP